MQLDSSGFITDLNLVKLFKSKSNITLPPRDLVLFREGDIPAGLYILQKGAVTISTKAQGEPFAVTVQTTVDSLLDLPGVVCHGVHAFTAVAHRGAELSLVNRADLTDLITSDSRLYKRILKVIAAEVDWGYQAIVRELAVGTEIDISSRRPASSLEDSRSLAVA